MYVHWLFMAYENLEYARVVEPNPYLIRGLACKHETPVSTTLKCRAPPPRLL